MVRLLLLGLTFLVNCAKCQNGGSSNAKAYNEQILFFRREKGVNRIVQFQKSDLRVTGQLKSSRLHLKCHGTPSESGSLPNMWFTDVTPPEPGQHVDETGGADNIKTIIINKSDCEGRNGNPKLKADLMTFGGKAFEKEYLLGSFELIYREAANSPIGWEKKGHVYKVALRFYLRGTELQLKQRPFFSVIAYKGRQLLIEKEKKKKTLTDSKQLAKRHYGYCGRHVRLKCYSQARPDGDSKTYPLLFQFVFLPEPIAVLETRYPYEVEKVAIDISWCNGATRKSNEVDEEFFNWMGKPPEPGPLTSLTLEADSMMFGDKMFTKTVQNNAFLVFEEKTISTTYNRGYELAKSPVKWNAEVAKEETIEDTIEDTTMENTPAVQAATVEDAPSEGVYDSSSNRGSRLASLDNSRSGVSSFVSSFESTPDSWRPSVTSDHLRIISEEIAVDDEEHGKAKGRTRQKDRRYKKHAKRHRRSR